MWPGRMTVSIQRWLMLTADLKKFYVGIPMHRQFIIKAYERDKMVCLSVHSYAQRRSEKRNLQIQSSIQCTSCPLLHYTSLLFRHHPSSIVCGHQDEHNSVLLRQVSSFHLRTIGGMLPRLSGWCLEFVASWTVEIDEMMGPGPMTERNLLTQKHNFG